jgi:energy-coupling factor transporter transmembrane protein EcfT
MHQPESEGTSVVVAATWTACAVTASLLLGDWRSLTTALIFGLLLASPTRDVLSNMRSVVLWTLPFAVPLVLIHGALNPAYPVSRTFGLLAVREQGLSYAVQVTLVLGLIASVAVVWRGARRADVLALVHLIRLPERLSLASAAAVSTLAVVQQRARLVSTAQQARGMPTGPGIRARAQAMVAIAVPLIVTSLVEADERATTLQTRGLGTCRIVPLVQLSWPIGARTRAASLIVTTITLVVAR